MLQVSEVKFTEILGSQLAGNLERALDVFRKCGPNLSYDVTNVLLHAVDQGKEEKVLSQLEAHYEEHLKYQHPEIRGTVVSHVSLGGVNKTALLFKSLCEETLGLSPHRTTY